jgi:hypothetical protein
MKDIESLLRLRNEMTTIIESLADMIAERVVARLDAPATRSADAPPPPPPVPAAKSRKGKAKAQEAAAPIEEATVHPSVPTYTGYPAVGKIIDAPAAAPAEVAAPAEEVAPPPAAPAATPEMARASLLKVLNTKGTAAAREVFAAFGASKISEVPAENLGELIEALEAAAI